MTDPVLYHAHDPMCSWCWGFRPTWKTFEESLPDSVNVVRLLGGLAPDSNEPMPIQMQQYLQQTWRHIESAIPGTQFNHAFWSECQPRRSTYPACRAVIAARLQGAEFEEPMIHAIQQAYYLEAKNPSDDGTLITLADSLGMDADRFADDLNAETTQQALEQEIVFAQRLGVQGFPSVVLLKEQTAIGIPVNHLNVDRMLDALHSALEH